MRNATSNLGVAIKAARKSKQLTQLELSEELGITPRHLQAIENENKTPSYDLLSRMLSFLNIPADSIINSTESELTPEQEQLLYLIRHKCNQRDIAVLLSTAEALVNTKEYFQSSHQTVVRSTVWFSFIHILQIS